MSYQHRAFEQLLGRLNEDEVAELLAFNDGSEYLEIPAYRQSGEPGRRQRARASLECEGLVQKDDGGWQATWLGKGVANWTLQRFLGGDSEPSLPALGENGRTRNDCCHRYRPVHFAPGRCWCARTREEHSWRNL